MTYRQQQQTATGNTASAPKLPPFEVVELTPVQTGNLLAFVSVRIGREPTAITVHKCRWIRQPGQVPFFLPPQEFWDGDDGKRRYKTLFEFPKAWRQPLTNAVVAAWEEQRQQATEARP